MKFTVNREKLTHCLQQAVGVAEKKTTMPILANLLIEANDNFLTLTATDLEVCLVNRCEAKVINPGRFTVPAKSFFEIIKEFPREIVEITLNENNQIELTSNKAQFRIVGIAPEDFPNFPKGEKAEFFELPSNALRNMIERTAFSISSDEMRYSLNGILLETAPEGGHVVLRLVSTDGHRLSFTEHRLDLKAAEQPFKDKVVLPKKGVMELKRLLDDSDQAVKFAFDGNNGIATYGGTTIYMRRIVGEFPDYHKVIPTEIKRSAMINRQSFIGSLKRMLLIASAKHKLVRFDFSNERLEMSCQNPELGTAREEIDVRLDGTPLTIGFNPRYFLDALAVIDEKEIEIGLVDELSPAIIVSKPSNFKCVIMPMRL